MKIFLKTVAVTKLFSVFKLCNPKMIKTVNLMLEYANPQSYHFCASIKAVNTKSQCHNIPVGDMLNFWKASH